VAALEVVDAVEVVDARTVTLLAGGGALLAALGTRCGVPQPASNATAAGAVAARARRQRRRGFRDF
jgi:hypothetical protein